MPYKDEYSAGGTILDPIFNGALRMRYIERYGRDQFGTRTCPGVPAVQNCQMAHNDAWNFYRSASAEYTKSWFNLHNAIDLNAVSLSGSVTWEKKKNSKDNYLGVIDPNGDGSADIRVWYNGKSYLAAEFQALTGNMDLR